MGRRKRFIGKLLSVSITGDITESPKGLEPGIGKLQESLSFLYPSPSLFLWLPCPSSSLPSFLPALLPLSLSRSFLIPAFPCASVLFSCFCRLACSVSHCAWLRVTPVQAALHFSYFKSTETADKVLLQCLINRKHVQSNLSSRTSPISNNSVLNQVVHGEMSQLSNKTSVLN